MSDSEGEDVQFGHMQSTPLINANPSSEDPSSDDPSSKVIAEEDGTRVVDSVITKKDSNDKKPDKPTMGDLIKIGKDD